MTTDPMAIRPPDDSGSSSFSRFAYQAHVAFPFCLNCALGGDIVSVFLEHIEDIAIQRVDRWQFIQVKTRDLDQGPWKLSDITGKGDAIHGMFRSHEALGNAPVTLELHLQGALKKSDDIVLLSTETGRRNTELQNKIKTCLKIDSNTCNEFLDRFRIKPDYPPRDMIESSNIRSLNGQAGHLPLNTLIAIYEAVVAKIEKTMQAGLLDVSWWTAIRDEASATTKARSAFEAKRMTKEQLKPLIGAIASSPQRLLERLIESDVAPPTVLEQKLLAGGASDALVRMAQTLRANSTKHKFEEFYSNSQMDDSVLEDVQQRLLVHAIGVRDLYTGESKSAVKMWTHLSDKLNEWAGGVDGRHLFGQDPHLLLGEICDLADRCLVDWGNVDA